MINDVDKKNRASRFNNSVHLKRRRNSKSALVLQHPTVVHLPIKFEATVW